MILWELLIVLLLIFLNGLFAMSELAVVSARRARLQVLAEQGSKGAVAALKLTEHPGRFLSTVQIGITLIGIFAGAYGGATLSEPLAAWIAEHHPALADSADTLALAIVVALITYLSLIVGELVPKQLALRNPERIAVLAAPPMTVLAFLAAPIVHLLDLSANLGLRLFGAEAQTEQKVTDEEIRTLLKEATEAGVVEHSEQAMIQGVMRLADRPVKALLTPRPDIVWLDPADADAENIATLRASPYSRYPVCRGSVDEILGVVQAKDLLDDVLAGKPLDLRACLREAPVVHEDASSLGLLETLRTSPLPLAFVVDEYGDLVGMVTATDVLESIVGDMAEHDGSVEPDVVVREDGSWLLDGGLPIDELKELLRLRELPDEDEFNTLAGYLLARLGHLPSTGEHMESDGYRFEIVDMDGRRIDKVLVAALPPEGSA